MKTSEALEGFAHVWLVCFGILTATMAWCCVPPAYGQTLKSVTEVVNVPVTVRGPDQRLVHGLKREDFALTENGKAQQIRYFSLTSDVPLTLGFLVDTTVCQDQALPLERETAKDFIRQVMQTGDQGFVLRFGANVQFLAHRTADTAVLSAAIDQLEIEPNAAARPHGRPTGHIHRGPHHLYDAIALGAAEMAMSPPGRKVLILLSDGYEQDSQTSQKAAIDATVRAGAAVYSINVVDPVLDLVPSFTRAGRAALARLSEQTGGRLFVVKPYYEAPSAFAEIADELPSQYFLGYTPSDRRHDGSFRRIQVSVSNPNYTTRTRWGYYASSD
jgi:VWFA-related protein